ncbi:MAG: orotidine-5'-phosphate decarboxylase [Arachnia sp.]
MGYRDRLDAAIRQRGQLCIGIDPMPSVLAAWGLPNDVSGLELCARNIVARLADSVAVFKPQSAFFEAHGSAGVAVLERVLADIRQAGALAVLDVKRGDIGSSMAGYATAYLADESPLRADAITVSPYLGVGAIEPLWQRAQAAGRGVYVLVRTSNPESDEVQTAVTPRGSVAQLVVDQVTEWGPDAGMVVGATRAQLDVDLSRFNGSILVPGIGTQGGTIDGARVTFGASFAQILPTVSRDVIGHGEAELKPRVASLIATLE